MLKMPNGYGSISKLSGNRRNPYMVRITQGGDRVQLGYYHTRKDALAALAQYNADPYDLRAHNYTLDEVYNLWAPDHFAGISPSAQATHRSAYKILTPIHDMPFKDLRLLHLQQTIDNSGKSGNMRLRAKNLLGLLYQYAIRHEITDKDYAQHIEIKQKSTAPANPHEPFTASEISRLWSAVGKQAYADTALILIYTGMRAGELCTMRAEDVHLDERYMIGGSKTAAGKNRIIPLNDKIVPLIAARMRTAEEYLIEPHIDYSAYQRQFAQLMDKLDMPQHRTHDCRHTFASLMDTAGVNDRALKTIIGHSGGDITSKVYIHKSLPELLCAVNCI